MIRKQPDWDQLESRYNKKLVHSLKTYFDQGGPFEITADDLTTEGSLKADKALALLQELTSEGVLKAETRFQCPHCHQELSSQEAQQETCPYEECGVVFAEEGGVTRTDVFIYEAPESRDVLWVLTLHGMNTRGSWQEEFSWLVSRSYRRMVPVAIYKYGIIRSGAVLKFRQRALTMQLVSRIRRLEGETEESGFGKRPDVIAHSFGTWLLGHALKKEKSLRVGRVILLGCILRPDFDWSGLIKSGQVEAVLNHHATNDFWAAISHYFIPDSGPSGRLGFNEQAGVVNIPAPGLGHSALFAPDRMRQQFENVWKPFLKKPADDLGDLGAEAPGRAQWKQSTWVLRATLPRYLVLFLALILLTFVLSSLAVGIFQIVSRFM